MFTLQAGMAPISRKSSSNWRERPPIVLQPHCGPIQQYCLLCDLVVRNLVWGDSPCSTPAWSRRSTPCAAYIGPDLECIDKNTTLEILKCIDWKIHHRFNSLTRVESFHVDRIGRLSIFYSILHIFILIDTMLRSSIMHCRQLLWDVSLYGCAWTISHCTALIEGSIKDCDPFLHICQRDYSHRHSHAGKYGKFIRNLDRDW